MIDPDELDDVAAKFGVDRSQVLRDHMISHVLAAISAADDGNLISFGGTALSRSVLPDGRLSEDVDLIAVDNRTAVASRGGDDKISSCVEFIGAATFRTGESRTAPPGPAPTTGGAWTRRSSRATSWSSSEGVGYCAS